MAKTEHLVVDATVHSAVLKDSRRYKISAKKFAESSCNYFLTRQINPVKIKEGETLSIQKHVTDEVNRAIGFLVRHEEFMLREILKVSLVNDTKIDILESTIINLLGVEKEDFEKLSKSNRERFQKRMEQINKRIYELAVLIKSPSVNMLKNVADGKKVNQ